MAKVIVRKTKQAEAVQIDSPEEKDLVLGWLEMMGVPREQAEETLDQLAAQKFWILRDLGDTTVYISHPADFLNDFEEVAEQDIVGSPFTEVSQTFLSEGFGNLSNDKS